MAGAFAPGHGYRPDANLDGRRLSFESRFSDELGRLQPVSFVAADGTLKFDHSSVTLSGAGSCSGCHQHDGSGPTHMDGILYGAGFCNSCHDYDVDAVTGDWGKNRRQSKDGAPMQPISAT